MTTKRTRASKDAIEKALTAAIDAGLTPTSFKYLPDGSFEVGFDEDAAPVKKKPTGWEDY